MNYFKGSLALLLFRRFSLSYSSIRLEPRSGRYGFFALAKRKRKENLWEQACLASVALFYNTRLTKQKIFLAIRF